MTVKFYIPVFDFMSAIVLVSLPIPLSLEDPTQTCPCSSPGQTNEHMLFIQTKYDVVIDYRSFPYPFPTVGTILFSRWQTYCKMWHMPYSGKSWNQIKCANERIGRRYQIVIKQTREKRVFCFLCVAWKQCCHSVKISLRGPSASDFGPCERMSWDGPVAHLADNRLHTSRTRPVCRATGLIAPAGPLAARPRFSISRLQ